MIIVHNVTENNSGDNNQNFLQIKNKQQNYYANEEDNIHLNMERNDFLSNILNLKVPSPNMMSVSQNHSKKSINSNGSAKFSHSPKSLTPNYPQGGKDKLKAPKFCLDQKSFENNSVGSYNQLSPQADRMSQNTIPSNSYK